jgi:hypothetical protein
VPNLYGVANPNPLPIIGSVTGGADFVCPPGAETNVYSVNVPPAVSPGWYYPAIYGIVSCSFGAALPGFLNWAARIGAGSDFNVQSTLVTTLTANGSTAIPIFLYGYQTFLQNPFGANTLYLTANCGTNGFTLRVVGTVIYGQWLRAPDQ